MNQTLHPTKRIEILKEKTMNEPRIASIEQAKIITRIYQENESLPRPLQRALALKAALGEMEISVEPEELIVGNRTKGVRAGVIFPESGLGWVNEEFETLPTREQDPFEITEGEADEFRRDIYSYWKGKSMEDIIARAGEGLLGPIKKVVKINQTDHAQGHICPNLESWLALGPAGLLEKTRIQKALPEHQNEKAQIFYESCELVLEGAQIFMRRYAELIKQMLADGEVDPAYRTDLQEVARICEKLADSPAQTFHEALQSTWFLFVILHMESNASSFSPGRLDQILYPYYLSDIEAGRMSEQEALELIEALWIKFNQIVYLRSAHSAKYFAGFPIGFNIAIDGVDENGEDAANALSSLFLKAQYDLGLPQPNLSVRLHKNTPSYLMQEAIDVVARGSGMPQFFNDEAIIEPMIEDLGIEPKDARNYCIVGCVELSTPGNSLGWSDAAMFNFSKLLELTLHHGVDLQTGKQIGPDFGGLDTYRSYEELENAFEAMMDVYIEKMMAAEDIVEKAHQDLLPSPFLSTVIDDCLTKGKDVTAGGAKYNLSGIQMIQAANLADSLAAIKHLVYETGRVDAVQLMHALANNFEGEEVLQTILQRKAAKYGNDEDEADAIAVKWASKFREKMKAWKNYRGGPVHTGMYTVSAHVPMGENVGASADGRKAGEPLADGGLSPVYGRDQHGPTAVLKSVSKLPNSCTTNGGLLNMKFLPSFFETQSGKDKFESFLRTFTDLQIPHVQFNVVRREDLLDAKAHPERHRSLTIRVAGYTAYFTELAGKLQDEIIERTAYEGL